MLRLLDAFCGAGGAGVGYNRAGFEVVGIDINKQLNYPFEFHQQDAIEYIIKHGHEFDAIHASPPCQRHSKMSTCRPGLAETYPDLIEPTRDALILTGKPYVIENVVGAPLRQDLSLCGQMFGLELYRHRMFESNIYLPQLSHPLHLIPASKAGHWKPGTIMSISGHIAPIKLAREAMGIDWTNRHELAEAIPPAYAEYIGTELMKHVLDSREQVL